MNLENWESVVDAGQQDEVEEELRPESQVVWEIFWIVVEDCHVGHCHVLSVGSLLFEFACVDCDVLPDERLFPILRLNTSVN